MKRNLIIILVMVFYFNGYSIENNSNKRCYHLNQTFKITTQFSIDYQIDSNLDIDLLLNNYSNCFKKPIEDQFLFNKYAALSNSYSQNLTTNNTFDNRSNEVKYIVGCAAIGALMGYVLADKLSPEETALRGGLLGLGVGVVYVFSL